MSSWVAAAAQTSALRIEAYFGGGLYVCLRAILSSLSPRKTEILPLHPALTPSPPYLPPPPPGFDPPLQPRWKDDRARKE